MRQLRWLVLFPVFVLGVVLVAGCGNDDEEDINGAGPRPGDPEQSLTATPADDDGNGDAVTANGIDAGDFPQLGDYTGASHTVADPAFEAIPGATAHYGTLGDAGYRIEMPDDWNGDLVLYAHGFRGFESTLTVDSPRGPLREELIERGYAWAASSFSENGYVPGIGADDTLALLGYFEDEFEAAGQTYLVGTSMGGNVVSLSLEHFDGVYDGGLSLCGAVGGQTQIDYLVSWVRLAEYFAEVELPLGEGASVGELTGVLLNDMAEALGTPSNPTADGEAFISAVRELTGGARPFFVEGMNEQYVANFGLLLADPQLQTVLARAATNADVEYEIEPGLGYDADEINEGIIRQEADPDARDAEENPSRVPTDGTLDAPLLALHTTGDLFVPITQASDYAEAADEAGHDDRFVARAIRASGHCSFSDAEIMTAFDDLVAWVEDGEEPAGDDLSGDLMDVGHDFTDPEREGDPGTP